MHQQLYTYPSGHNDDNEESNEEIDTADYSLEFYTIQENDLSTHADYECLGDLSEDFIEVFLREQRFYEDF